MSKIDTKQILQRKDISIEFAKELQLRLAETGKRRTVLLTWFVLLGGFFFLCNYFQITKISFLGSEFNIEQGHINWAAVACLSVLYLYFIFLLGHESRIIFILDACYHSFGLPETLSNNEVFALILYPSPLVYSLHAYEQDEKNVFFRVVAIFMRYMIIAILLIAPLLLIAFFAYLGIASLGIIKMIPPLVVSTISLLMVARFIFPSQQSFTHISEEDRRSLSSEA